MSIPWTTVEDAVHAWVVAGSGLSASQVIWSQQDGPRPSGAFVALQVLSVQRRGQDWQDVVDAPLVFSDKEIEDVDDSSDDLTITAHGLGTGDGPVRFETTGVLPAGLAAATDYFVIRVDADTVQVAATFADALAGTQVDVTDAGTGTHSVVDTPDTVAAGEEIELRARGVREVTLSVQCFDGAATGSSSSWARLDGVVSAAALETRRAALNAAGVGVAGFGPVQAVGGVIGSSEFEPRAILECRFFLASEVSEPATYMGSVELENLITGQSTVVTLQE